MITVDYPFYSETFQGKASKEDFERLDIKASAYLDRVTFGRLSSVIDTDVIDRAKLARCALVDAYLLNEQGGGIASESNDGITVNYVAGISNTKSENQRLREAASLFLGGTGLLYRGVD